MTFLSPEPEKMKKLSFDIARLFIQSVWPFNSPKRLKSSMLHIFMQWSTDPDIRIFES